MRYGGVNVLIGETRPFPSHYMHPRWCASGHLAEKLQFRKLSVGICRVSVRQQSGSYLAQGPHYVAI
jgi:hypothetical protein